MEQSKMNISSETLHKTLKENLVAIPNAVSKVGIITGYTFTWKSDVENFAEVESMLTLDVDEVSIV